MSKAPDDSQKIYAKAKLKKFAFYYTLIFAPICLIIMFWPLGDNVSKHGVYAHYIAVVLAFLSGLVFMSIFFFSSNSGSDHQPNFVEIMKKQKQDND